MEDLQSSLASQSGVKTNKQGKVLFGGKKLKAADVLEEVGVENGSVINVVPGKGKKKDTVAAGAGAAAAGGSMDNMMKDMMEKAGVDPSQLDEMMKQMGGVKGLTETLDRVEGMIDKIGGLMPAANLLGGEKKKEQK